MKNIFVASDFTEHSDLAMSAANVLKNENIQVQGFHWDSVINKMKKMNILQSDEELYTQINEWKKKIPLHLKDDILAQFKRLGLELTDFSFDITEGDKFSSLQDYFEKKSDNDLIMLTTSDDSFLERVFFGNFVEKLIFGTKQPVYLVKKEVKEAPKKIGICFDPDQDNEGFFNHALSLAKLFKSSVDIIYVEAFDSRDLHQNVFATNQDSEKNKNNYLAYKRKLAEEKFEEYAEKFKKEGIDTDINLIITVDKTPAENLKKHLKDNPVDLLFVEPHPGFKNGFKFNSTSYDLIKNVPVNFLIIKERHS